LDGKRLQPAGSGISAAWLLDTQDGF
jgi:hypothetical protein